MLTWCDWPKKTEEKMELYHMYNKQSLYSITLTVHRAIMR
jgi:hypothetical protein